MMTLDQAELALAEAVHRAKNDLQTVSSMLRLQAQGTADPAIAGALLEAENRVFALARLNDRLDARATSVETTIDIRILLEGLAADLRAIHFEGRRVQLAMDADAHRIAVAYGRPIGLIVNELIINALKYAFPDGRRGTIRVEFRCPHGFCTLSVTDDGIGLDMTAPPKGTGLGRRVVHALSAQIGGSFVVGSGPDGAGTRCVVRWPWPALESAAEQRDSDGK